MMDTTTEDTLHETAAQICAQNDLRYTSTRRAIVEALASATAPITIDEILSSNTGLAQSSLYRNIEALKTAGVVAAITLDSEGTRFELAEELGHHHHHMICSDCGSIADFELDHKLEDLLDSTLHKISKKSGFKVQAHTLDLQGVCASCVN